MLDCHDAVAGTLAHSSFALPAPRGAARTMFNLGPETRTREFGLESVVDRAPSVYVTRATSPDHFLER